MLKLRFMIPAAVGAVLGLAVAVAPSAHAGLPATRVTLPALGATAANPNGMAMDALNWGGIGNSSTCTSGAGVVNDPLGVWKEHGAGCAADFQILPDAVPGTFQIQYNPSGNTSANLCVSTISNTPGTHARLRPCAFGGNTWQTFTKTLPVPPSDITDGVQLTPAAAPGLALNDQGFGGNGSAVIVWTAVPARANSIWLVP